MRPGRVLRIDDDISDKYKKEDPIYCYFSGDESETSEEEENPQHHCHGKPIHKRPSTLQEERDNTIKKAQREYKAQKCIIRGRSKRKFEKYTTGLPQCRANYINNWATGPRKYVFRADPFKLPILPPPPEPDRLKKRVRHERSTTAVELVSPPIYHLLGLSNERFGDRFFTGLGPMELLNVYRTSRAMRTALVTCLGACVDYIMQCMIPEATALERGDNLQKTREILATGARLSLQSEDLARSLLHLTYCLCAFSRVYAPDKSKIHNRASNMKQGLRSALCYVTRRDPSSGEWRVAPLSSTNVFTSRHLVKVKQTTARRFEKKYTVGDATRIRESANDIAYFDHTDWIDARLQPVDPHDDSSTLCPDEVVFIDSESGTMRGISQWTALDGAADDPVFLVSLEHDPLTARMYAGNNPLALQPGLVDLYEIRLVVHRKMTTYTAILCDEPVPAAERESSIWNDDRFTQLSDSLDEFRATVTPFLPKQPDDDDDV